MMVWLAVTQSEGDLNPRMRPTTTLERAVEIVEQFAERCGAVSDPDAESGSSDVGMTWFTSVRGEARIDGPFRVEG